MSDLTVKEVCKRLHELETRWPKGDMMIMANGHALYLCDRHPNAGGRIIESFSIPSDGGDPDWAEDQPQ